MRVSSFSNVPFIPPIAPQAVPPQIPCAPPAPAAFLPFSAQAFDQARLRDVPVLLFICDAPPSFVDAALNMQIFERTVPVWLYPGMRPDVELLCQRAGALFSGEGALPLCALMLEDARVFLAAPLPPAGFALDPSRLYVWLSQADRRFAQNRDAFIRQAAQTVRSFRAEPLRKPYSPGDAAHDLTRALLAVHDPINGGFGKLKQPLCPALRFLSRAALRDRQAHAALDQTLDAMLASDLYDPLDGAFFRATLTEDWRAFVPEKPLAINALLALTLLESGRRAEAVRTLDFLLSACFAPGGALNPCLTYDRESCAFTPEQVCAALGGEDGLRVCRLLGLRRQHTGLPPKVTPSRFSPVEDSPEADLPRTPTLPRSLTPEDAAFLRRVMPQLQRVRAARTPPTPHALLLTEVENADELLAQMPADPQCEDITTRKGAKDTYYYSTANMSDNYAMIAQLIEDKDLCVMFAEMVRFNARIYPSATPLKYFQRSPYGLAPEVIEQTWKAMQENPAYADIEELTNNQNERFLFSTKHLTRRYAKAISDVDDFCD